MKTRRHISVLPYIGKITGPDSKKTGFDSIKTSFKYSKNKSKWQYEYQHAQKPRYNALNGGYKSARFTQGVLNIKTPKISVFAIIKEAGKCRAY